MAYILAFLKAFPVLVELVRDLVAGVGSLVEEQRKHRLETEIANDIAIAKTKGDTSGLEKLLGKRTPTP